jgi:chain length determinant protein EpsF
VGPIEVWLAGLISKKLDARPDKNSSVVSIQYVASDPAFAAAVANAYAEAYIEANLDIRVEPAKKTAAWFDQQAQVLRDKLEAAQAKLSQYQRDTRIVATDERLDVENARLNELSTQLTVIQAQAMDTQNRERKARELVAKDSSADELAEIIAMPVVVSLKVDLARTEAKLKELSAQYGKNHPQYKQVAAQAEEIRQKLAHEVSSGVSAITNTNTVNQRRAGEMRAAVEGQREKVLKIKQQRDEIAVLMRDVESAQRAYDMSMQRLMQTSLEGQANQTNISILSRATPPLVPSSPKPLLNLLLSVVMGSMLGFGAALLAEVFNRRVRSSDDLRTLLGIPVLGSMPKLARGRSLPLLGAK